jgi:hypothetical protein
MLEAYGYKQQIINNLNNIDNDTNNFYNYNGLNFLSKLNSKNENIVIVFHGAVPNFGTDRIFFRGVDWEITNTDIICISDYLINIYNEVQINWTLSTKKFESHNIYIDLFTNIFNKKKYKNIIFTGSSAGGLSSIKFSCIFNAVAIIGNPQLYLEKYNSFKKGRIKQGDGRFGLLDIMIKYNDEIIYNNKDVEKYILDNKPKCVILYQNIDDIHHYKSHFLPFKDFVSKYKLQEHFHLISFKYKSETDLTETEYHSICFPNNKKHLDILQEFLKNN